MLPFLMMTMGALSCIASFLLALWATQPYVPEQPKPARLPVAKVVRR